MRHLFLLSASACVFAIAGCSSVSGLWSDDSAKPAEKSEAKAEAAPSPTASATEEKEMKALMGDKAPDAALPEAYVAPKDTPPPPAMDPSAPATDKADTASAPAANAPADCPEVQVLPDTRSLTYFDDPEGKPTGPMVARASLVDIRGGCEYSANSVAVDIDMIMKGKITDKGRYEGRKDLEAFMTFPYFVAVMDPDGRMIDKKIMATAMRFKPQIDDLDHAEKITQTIALPNVALGPKYTITVGFQLNRAQLDYNRGTVSDKAEPAAKPEEKKEPAKAEPKAEVKAEVKPEEKAEVKADAKADAPEKSATPAPALPAAKSGGAKMQPITE